MNGDLPPSSSETFFTSCAAAIITRRPVGTEPVKASLSTSRWSVSGSPASLPVPETTFSTPRGRPISSAIPPSSRAVSGVSSEGFSTTVAPAASAGATFHAAISRG